MDKPCGQVATSGRTDEKPRSLHTSLWSVPAAAQIAMAFTLQSALVASSSYAAATTEELEQKGILQLG